MLKPTPKPLIGVDIGSSAVKLVEFQKTGDGYKLSAFALEPIPADAIVEKNIVNVDAVSIALKTALKNSGSKSKNAAVAVPTSAVMSKVLTLPADLEEDEVEAQILADAGQYIPGYDPNDVFMDHLLQGPTSNAPSSQDVLLVAARREHVDTRTSVLDLAGLKPVVVDVEQYAIEHCFPLLRHDMPDKGKKKLIAIFDIGSHMNAMYILDNGEVIYNREQNFGGRLLTEEIMRRFGMSFPNAEQAKKTQNLPDKDEYQSNIVQPFKDTIAQQVSRLLQFFYSASGEDHVDQIMLSGGATALLNLDEHVSDFTGIPCVIAKPLAKVQARAFARKIESDGHGLLVACGLALRSFHA